MSVINNIDNIVIHGGVTKTGEEEPVNELILEQGEVVAVVGPTGSGKSMLLADIEQVAEGDTPSRRKVFININKSSSGNGRLIAQLSQTMNFIVDIKVRDFLELHASSQGITDRSIIDEVISMANNLAGEPVSPDTNMTTLSGGQSRAVMIADIAVISDSPVVLIDEIENAGIDKLRALDLLSYQGKIVLVASHDPLIILRADRRIVMRDGGMSRIAMTGNQERELLTSLTVWDQELSILRDSLRKGLDVETRVEATSL
jgi:ABC-type lipoprotein export system ATPase subunit